MDLIMNIFKCDEVISTIYSASNQYIIHIASICELSQFTNEVSELMLADSS